ncbi:hypothetical protein CERZMDRAFT_120929 [Cercospora zeae-maydis SCOH1-5]|uniref:Uncharacterized protein n=1 Tax=Cercospora zeae-maydis SCOH1-5 TaxID=717836 RepID=A0A6A6FI12_9PEZI|nr:hypothetical protein CERZMDRAFT_120929 [Cercospora zeae-maydis SCOH1-5]
MHPHLGRCSDEDVRIVTHDRHLACPVWHKGMLSKSWLGDNGFDNASLAFTVQERVSEGSHPWRSRKSLLSRPINLLLLACSPLLHT